jgi:CRISPR/Cas system CSM-associated protein Csm5 (group 7 of RAMP superfamily)
MTKKKKINRVIKKKQASELKKDVEYYNAPSTRSLLTIIYLLGNVKLVIKW